VTKLPFSKKHFEISIQLYLKIVLVNTYLTVAIQKAVLKEQFLDFTSGPIRAQPGDVSTHPQVHL